MLVWSLFCEKRSEMIIIIVPDRRSRILEVVIVRRLVTWVRFGGGRDWERVEKGEVSLQAT
jgi:hypothetical protein